MALNLTILTNLTNITNTTTPSLPLSMPAIPSLAYLAVAMIFLFFITKMGVKIIETISNFLLPILIIGSSLLLIPIYSNIIRNYLPAVIVNKILSYRMLPFAFYDKILYYYALYDISFYETLTPFLLLYLFFLYITYSLYKRGYILVAPIFSYIILMILSLGGLGMLTAILHYKPLLIIVGGTFVAYYIYILLVHYLFS